MSEQDAFIKHLCADIVITGKSGNDIDDDFWFHPYTTQMNKGVYNVEDGHHTNVYGALQSIYFRDYDLFFQAGEIFIVEWYDTSTAIFIKRMP